MAFRNDLVDRDLSARRVCIRGNDMNGLRGILAAGWWLALVIWTTAIAIPGAAAMIAFTRLPPLGVTMAGTEDYFAGDAEASGRFVAGFVANPLFAASDVACVAAATIAWIAMLGTRFRPCGEGLGRVLAVIAVTLATLVLGWYLFTIASPLAESLGAWRDAVLADDRLAAETAWAIFDPLHESASLLLRIELLLLIVAIIAGGAATRIKSPAKESDS